MSRLIRMVSLLCHELGFFLGGFGEEWDFFFRILENFYDMRRDLGRDLRSAENGVEF